MKLVISDAHEGLKDAIPAFVGAPGTLPASTWTRNALAYVPAPATMVAAGLARPSSSQIKRRRCSPAACRRPAPQPLAEAEGLHRGDAEGRARLHGLPTQHRTKLHSTNPLERLNKEIKRRADVVGIFPNEDSIHA